MAFYDKSKAKGMNIKMIEYPMVSIIIPIYNVKPFLRCCINSVLSQTYYNLEIILVDDGSTDGSGKICDMYARKDKRIHVIHKKNGGLSDARNVGLKASTADYIAFIDSDDYVAKQYIQCLIEILFKNNADIAICAYYSKEKDKFYNIKKHCKKIQCFDSKTMLHNWHGEYKSVETISWNKLYKKILFTEKNIYYPVGYIYEDAQITHLLIDNASKVVITNEKLYFYRKRKNSISSLVSYKNIHDCIYAQEIRLNFFKKNKYQEAYERLLIKYQKYLMLTYCSIQDKELEECKKSLLKRYYYNYFDTIQTSQIKASEVLLFWMFLRYYFVFNLVFKVINMICTER